MYEETTYEVILQRMLDRVSDSLDKRESSLIWDTHSSTAIELQILYIELDTMIANSYGDTASREFLILLCKDRVIYPKEASKAILKGTFTPINIDVTGQRFNIGDLNYLVKEQLSLGQYRVECETAGIIGNQYFGTMIPMEYITGLETAELTEVLIPGEDEEDTKHLRQRYVDSFNAQAFGGNRADYIAKVRDIDGVGDCKVTRVWNGNIRPSDLIPTDTITTWYKSVIGTVDPDVATWLSSVYIAAYEKKLTVGGTVLITIVNSLNYGEASNILIDSVQTKIDPEHNAGEGYGLAPIGHVVAVKSASPISIDVTIDITFQDGYGWSNLQTAIENAASSYMSELRQSWGKSSQLVVRVSQLETRILGVTGIIDVSNTKINGSADNMTLGAYEIPVMGGVSAW